jgi:hypothetical protein
MIFRLQRFQAWRIGHVATGFTRSVAKFSQHVRSAVLASLLVVGLIVGCGPPMPKSDSRGETSGGTASQPRNDDDLVALAEAVLRAAEEMSAAAAALHAAAALPQVAPVNETDPAPELPVELEQQRIRTHAARAQQAHLLEQMQLAKTPQQRIITVAEFLAPETAIAKLFQGQDLTTEDVLALARLDDNQRLRLRVMGATDDTIEKVQSKVAELISQGIEGLIRETNTLSAAEVTAIVDKLRLALFDDAERDLTPGLPPSD